MPRASVKRATRERAPKPSDRPFDTALLDRARAIAQKYRIILEPSDECGYVGSALEMPLVFGDGTSADVCVASVRESLTVAVAHILEKGEEPPVPADEQQRNKQINIRVTEAEQRRIREAATARGFTDLSDYVRTTSLQAP